MAKMDAGSTRLYLVLGFGLAIGLALRAAMWVQASIEELPIKQAPRVERAAVSMDAKKFYPVWVKQASARPPAAVEARVDDLFKREDDLEAARREKVAPDYEALFRQATKITGIADNGVFANGRFYKVGGRMEPLSAEGGPSISPVVASVSAERVVFLVGSKRVVWARSPERK